MAIAYAESMRSSCLKRKVGAVIVDLSGAVVSSGYNEVPAANNTCKCEYGMCYRDKLKKDYKESLDATIKKEKEKNSGHLRRCQHQLYLHQHIHAICVQIRLRKLE